MYPTYCKSCIGIRKSQKWKDANREKYLLSVRKYNNEKRKRLDKLCTGCYKRWIKRNLVRDREKKWII